MNDAGYIVDIDRLVLTDVGVAPSQALHLRGLIETELRQALQPRHPDAHAEAVPAAAPHLAGSGQYHLAGTIARSIVRAVRSGEA